MQLNEAKFFISSAKLEQCPQTNVPEFAFIGRSNVGKSSLINLITSQKSLAKTSATPGKTQLINHFTILSNTGKAKKHQWFLVDLPGYGYAKVSQKNRKQFSKMIVDYICNRKQLVQLFVLIDSRHSPQNIDIEFVNFLGEEQVPFCLVFTKSDKEKPLVVERNVKQFLDEMRKSWEFLPPSFITSAVKKQGKDELLNYIEQLLISNS